MRFEYDRAKSTINRLKHGIDFKQAQAIWLDGDAMEIPARSDHEPRFVVVGRIGGKFWSAFVTYRGESVRIISVRRSRTTEVRNYEGG